MTGVQTCALPILDNTTGKRYPALATEWAIEPDGNGYRFKLRQGVQFHKGMGEFTSKDLVQPWKEILKDDSISGVTEFWRQALQDIQPVNDYEVVFRFKRPDGNFLDYVSDQLGGYEIWSKKNFDQTGPPTNLTMPALAGTGSYQYKERTQGQFVRFEAVPYQHWRHNPEFKEFEFRWIKEASTRIAALLAGEVHMAALPQDLEAQAERAGMKTFAGKVPGYRVFVQFYCCAMKDRNNDQSGWMEPQGPLADTKVRRALAKAVNLNELNKSLDRKSTRLNSSHIPLSRMPSSA